MPKITLDRFERGLIKHNLSLEEIKNGDWKYAGGCQGRHLNYFNLIKQTKDLKMPLKVDKCICGHHIEENCYITNGDRIIVLGNCCIKKFIPKNTRTCSECGEPHKNRIVDRCNECRVGVCDGCGKDIAEKYKKCYTCFNSSNS